MVNNGVQAYSRNRVLPLVRNLKPRPRSQQLLSEVWGGRLDEDPGYPERGGL